MTGRQTEPLVPAGTPYTDFMVDVWSVHDTGGVEHGVFEDEPTALGVAREVMARSQGAGVQVFITKTTYHSIVFHKRSHKA